MSITLGIKITLDVETTEDAESILNSIWCVEDIYYSTED